MHNLQVCAVAVCVAASGAPPLRSRWKQETRLDCDVNLHPLIDVSGSQFLRQTMRMLNIFNQTFTKITSKKKKLTTAIIQASLFSNNHVSHAQGRP